MEYEIEKYGLCKGAVEFRSEFSSFEEFWESCHRGDWMLHIAYKVVVDKRNLTLAKALCAKTVIHLMADERSINAVDVAERYGNVLATDEELKKAYAYAAAAAAYAYAYASDAYAYAAYAASAAAYASDAYAADAAAAAAAAVAASAAYADDAKTKNRLETSDICRQILTKEVFDNIKNI